MLRQERRWCDERWVAQQERGGAVREGRHNERGTAWQERHGMMIEVVARQERVAYQNRGGATREGWHNERGMARQERCGTMRE